MASRVAWGGLGGTPNPISFNNMCNLTSRGPVAFGRPHGPSIHRWGGGWGGRVGMCHIYMGPKMYIQGRGAISRQRNETSPQHRSVHLGSTGMQPSGTGGIPDAPGYFRSMGMYARSCGIWERACYLMIRRVRAMGHG